MGKGKKKKDQVAGVRGYIVRCEDAKETDVMSCFQVAAGALTQYF